MKEREPDFEDDKMRAWLRKPQEENWEGLGEDPTVMTIEEETEEIFESRTYHLRPTPEAYLLALDVLRATMDPQMLRLPPELLADRVVGMVDDTMIKFLAKRRKEDGRITHILVAITGGSRRLLDQGDWVEEDQYRKTVDCFEELPLSKAILTQPAVVTLDDWRRYADGGPLSRSDLGEAASQLDMEQDSKPHPAAQ
jgi:hypothetical protein